MSDPLSLLYLNPKGKQQNIPLTFPITTGPAATDPFPPAASCFPVPWHSGSVAKKKEGPDAFASKPLRSVRKISRSGIYPIRNSSEGNTPDLCISLSFCRLLYRRITSPEYILPLSEALHREPRRLPHREGCCAQGPQTSSRTRNPLSDGRWKRPCRAHSPHPA